MEKTERLTAAGDKSRSCFSLGAKRDTGSGASLAIRKEGKWKEWTVNSLIAMLMKGVEGKPAFYPGENHQITF